MRQGDGGEGLDDLSDEALMAEVAAGNHGAFAVLSRRHTKRSLRVAQRVVSDADAEEVVQDVLIQIWRHADSWRGEGARFTTWLYRLVVNRAVDYRRRRVTLPIEAAAEIPCPRPGAERLVEERQLADKVEAALATLPERQRLALSLCYHEQLSCAEAAAVLNLSVSATESLLVRARRHMRAHLRPEILVGAEKGR